MKKVLIRADDLGFSRAINLGIADSVKGGLIRSIGIMPNMPEAENGYKLVKGNDICFGQHTNICAGKPLSDSALIPSLVDDRGYFKTSKEYRSAFSRGEDIVNVDEAVIEIEAQYQKYKEIVKDEPHYFEGHAIASGNFFKALEIVGERHGLRMFPVSFDSKPMNFEGKKLRMTIDSMGPEYDPYSSLRKLILDEDKDVIDIFVAHPGYLDAYIIRNSSLTVNRTKEVEMLTDDNFVKWVKDQKAELITYDNL